MAEVGYWDEAVTQQDTYSEHPYEPFSTHQGSQPSWGSGSGFGPSVDVAAPSTKGRASPAGVEPPYKKMRNMNGESGESQSGMGGTEYMDGSAGEYGADFGSEDGLYFRSASGVGMNTGAAPAEVQDFQVGQSYGATSSGTYRYGVPGMQNYGSVNDQSYGYAGDQNYDSEHGYQQMPGYTPNIPGGGIENHDSQHVPHQSYSGSAGSAKGPANLFYKTKLCTKFKSGTCTFNERCTFAHGMEELRKPPHGWENMVNLAGGPRTGGKDAVPYLAAGQATGPKPLKSRLCRYFMEGNCPYGGRCNFLHGNQEERPESAAAGNSIAGQVGSRGPHSAKPSYKTRLCAKWETGEPCGFGDKCHFAHGLAELQRYGGGTVHPDVGASIGTVQSVKLRLEMAAPATYSTDVVFSGSIDKQVGDNSVCTSNINPYQSQGTEANALSSPQNGIDGVTTKFGYWIEEKWEGESSATKQPSLDSQGYAQANQTDAWMAQYSVDEGYFGKIDSVDEGYFGKIEEAAFSHYSQRQSHQQNAPFFRAGSIHNYPGSKQDLCLSYGQDDDENKYQGSLRNGEVSYVESVQNDPMYSDQQAHYAAKYSVSDAWGANM